MTAGDNVTSQTAFYSRIHTIVNLPYITHIGICFLQFNSFTYIRTFPVFVVVRVCLSWTIRSKPAGRNPLRFFLSMLYSGEEIHAWILQIFIHNHTVKKLTVLGLHGPAHVLNVHKVFILRKSVWRYMLCLHQNAYRPIIRNRCITRNIKCISYMEVSLNVSIGKKMWVFSCLSHAFRRWWTHIYDVGLQLLVSD